ncbi:MAG: hypothetical protein IPJ54_11260 [Saprospiraceae bacterium]|nr:hypothetical protein [Saprospiraceae bacterium]
MKETMDQVGLTSVDLRQALKILNTGLKIGLTARLIIDVLVLSLKHGKACSCIDRKISWTEFAKSTIDAFTDIGKRAADGYSNAFNENVKLNIAGSTSGTDRLSGYAKLREGTGGASFMPKVKAGKKVDQFSALPEDVKIKSGLFDIGDLPVTGNTDLSPFIESLNLIPPAIKSTEDLNFKMLELGRSMNAAFVEPTIKVETFTDKLKGIAAEIANVANEVEVNWLAYLAQYKAY